MTRTSSCKALVSAKPGRPGVHKRELRYLMRPDIASDALARAPPSSDSRAHIALLFLLKSGSAQSVRTDYPFKFRGLVDVYENATGINQVSVVSRNDSLCRDLIIQEIDSQQLSVDVVFDQVETIA